jgi:hypothetical protein
MRSHVIISSSAAQAEPRKSAPYSFFALAGRHAASSAAATATSVKSATAQIYIAFETEIANGKCGNRRNGLHCAIKCEPESIRGCRRDCKDI